MGRKKRADETKMLGLRVNAALWERFQEYVEDRKRSGELPRMSDTAMLELVVYEFLERKQRSKKETGK